MAMRPPALTVTGAVAVMGPPPLLVAQVAHPIGPEVVIGPPVIGAVVVIEVTVPAPDTVWQMPSNPSSCEPLQLLNSPVMSPTAAILGTPVAVVFFRTPVASPDSKVPFSPLTVTAFDPLVVASTLNSEAVGGEPPRTIPVKAPEDDSTVPDEK